MKIIKKVVLNKNERNMIKYALYMRGETFRSWAKKVCGKETKTTAPISNIIANGVVTKKVYDKVLKPLDLPYFKNFKWEEETRPMRNAIKFVEEDE